MYGSTKICHLSLSYDWDLQTTELWEWSMLRWEAMLNWIWCLSKVMPYHVPYLSWLLIRNLESNNNVKNINVCGKGISKVSAYADDVALLTSDIPSIVESLKTYEKFSKVSGLYINLEKTEIMNLIKHINGESLNGEIYGSPVIINTTLSSKLKLQLRSPNKRALRKV